MSASESYPSFALDTASATPWVHPYNMTVDMELAAAQRVGGILVTKLERSQNAEYDAALRERGMADPELAGIEVSEESIARVGAVIHALKVRAMQAANPASGSVGRTAVTLA